MIPTRLLVESTFRTLVPTATSPLTARDVRVPIDVSPGADVTPLPRALPVRTDVPPIW